MKASFKTFSALLIAVNLSVILCFTFSFASNSYALHVVGQDKTSQPSLQGADNQNNGEQSFGTRFHRLEGEETEEEEERLVRRGDNFSGGYWDHNHQSSAFHPYQRQPVADHSQAQCYDPLISMQQPQLYGTYMQQNSMHPDQFEASPQQQYYQEANMHHHNYNNNDYHYPPAHFNVPPQEIIAAPHAAVAVHPRRTAVYKDDIGTTYEYSEQPASSNGETTGPFNFDDFNPDLTEEPDEDHSCQQSQTSESHGSDSNYSVREQSSSGTEPYTPKKGKGPISSMLFANNDHLSSIFANTGWTPPKLVQEPQDQGRQQERFYEVATIGGVKGRFMKAKYLSPSEKKIRGELGLLPPEFQTSWTTRSELCKENRRRQEEESEEERRRRKENPRKYKKMMRELEAGRLSETEKARYEKTKLAYGKNRPDLNAVYFFPDLPKEPPQSGV